MDRVITHPTVPDRSRSIWEKSRLINLPSAKTSVCCSAAPSSCIEICPSLVVSRQSKHSRSSRTATAALMIGCGWTRWGGIVWNGGPTPVLPGPWPRLVAWSSMLWSGCMACVARRGVAGLGFDLHSTVYRVAGPDTHVYAASWPLPLRFGERTQLLPQASFP